MIGFYIRDGLEIAEGRKSAVVTPTLRDNLSGPRALVVREGERAAVVGIVVFSPPAPVTAEGLKALGAEHRISVEDQQRWWPAHDEFYVHRVKAYYPFAVPQPIDFEPGSNMDIAVTLQAEILGVKRVGSKFCHTVGVKLR